MMGVARAPLPSLRKGPFTSSHLVRWCAAQHNWHKIHFDLPYAQRKAGLPERLIPGALKQHLLVQFLENAFPGGWVERMDFRFTGPDLAGQWLEIRGRVLDVFPEVGASRFQVALEIHNADAGSPTTVGTALVLAQADGFPRPSASPAPPGGGERLDLTGEGTELARRFGLELGETLERLRSDYAIDHSRLRLFADAIGDLHPRYFDCDEAVRLGYPAVVAPPLFPIHALELRPGACPLSHDPDAWGREGVSELGRSVGERLGLPGEKMVNGGSAVRVHSLAVAGETVVGDSRLMALVSRPRASGGPLVRIETFNTYATTDGRLLVEERVGVLYRGVAL